MPEPALMPGETIPEAPSTGPTPLSRFAGQVTSSDLLGARIGAGAREAQLATESAGRSREHLGRLKETSAAQATERAATRPEPPQISPPPSTAVRPFLAPGEGFLGQLQTAIVGATQMALGVGGLKGRGHAIAAVAGLKGALEGWQQGDRERVDRALTEWHASSKSLLENHRLRREAYTDLLTDQKRSIEEILAEMEITAKIDGDEQLAAAAHTRNLDAVIGHLSQQEMKAATLGLGNKRLDAEIEHWKAQAAKADRDFAALQEQRRITNQRLEEGLKLRKESAAGVAKLEKEDDAISIALRNMEALEGSVKRLDQKGIIPKGATAADKLRASVALQTSFGDTEIAQDIENVKRLGTALLVGSEIASGLSPSVARLKIIGEAEAAGATAIPKSFWDQWFIRQRQSFADRRKTIRSHLQARAGSSGPANEGWTAEQVE